MNQDIRESGVMDISRPIPEGVCTPLIRETNYFIAVLQQNS